MDCATNSFPVPLSPVINTDESPLAIFSANFIAVKKLELFPIILSKV